MTVASLGASSPIAMAPDFRVAGNDWQGVNALVYVVYAVVPTYDADGNVATSGVLRPLDGCEVVGTARYQQRPGSAPTPVSALAGLITLTGDIVDPSRGLVSLSLPRAQTVFPRQDPALWNDGAPDPTRALLIVEPGIIDADGNLVSIGLQPLFVF